MADMIIELEIVEARDLLASDSNGFSDPYVVVEKTPGLQSGAKTPTIKKNLNPVWNYSTVLHFDQNLQKIKFKVYDWDRFSSDDLLGCCSFTPSIFNDGVPLDVWEPLKLKPPKKPGEKRKVKGPYETKGELHIKMSAKNACQFCNPGGWFAIQGVSAGAGPQMVPMSMAGAGPSIPYGQICLGLGWDFEKGFGVDLDASVIAFDAQLSKLELVYFGNRDGFCGAIHHSGDNRTGAGEGDDEVITLDLQRIPPEVVRLACVVNSFKSTSLSAAKSAYVRVFAGSQTIGIQKLSKVCDTIGLLFCFFQRNSAGAWFFQTAIYPVGGNTADRSIDAVRGYFANVPLF